MSLWQDFLTNDQRVVQKWVHYFPIYERHLSCWKNKTLTVLEIGVSMGGSLQMWQRYFGPLAKIVGVDIDHRCKDAEEPGIYVRIGSQADSGFLKSVIDEFGIPDIVIDDGSHIMSDISATFDFLYPLMPKNGIYVVEDLHAAYWPQYGGGVDVPTTFINRCKHFIDELNAHYSNGAVSPTFVTNQTLGISFYDSVVVFEKGEIFRRDAPQIGRRTLAERVKWKLG